MTLRERLEKMVMFEPNTGCWFWIGSLTASGSYGQISVNGVPKRAHRVSFEVYKHNISNGLLVLHHCDNSMCINPDHLFLGTYADNTRDMIKKGRAKLSPAYGKNNPRNKFTENDILNIRNRRENGESLYVMATEYNTSISTLSYIVKRKTWTNI